ncbi:hypothetical protein POM88_032933 [Heracleum sosnowskyi]|uniref:Translation initiation factor 5A C-terminal domain-containing protein n=1 Tax=Heracleum sosnowskyi TaxID=360622 RepID=A0AAD8MHZ9_9APIA|nr:hypothetical protein POM88_032933 [Heracleum sosnowskyi]
MLGTDFMEASNKKHVKNIKEVVNDCGVGWPILVEIDKKEISEIKEVANACEVEGEGDEKLVDDRNSVRVEMKEIPDIKEAVNVCEVEGYYKPVDDMQTADSIGCNINVMANKIRDRDLWGDESVQNYPPNGFKPETRTLVKQVDDLIVTSFVCVKGNPCKIVEIRTPTDAAKRQFIAIDIFNGKVYKATFPLSGDCLVPIVTLSDYKLVYICEEDSRVILLDDKGRKKCNLKLPTDEALLSQIKFEFAEGKDVFVSVVSAMGKEQIIAATRKSLLQRYYPKVT